MFLGYCFSAMTGRWTPAVHLETAEQAFTYCKLHYRLFQEIRITDEEDYVVLHVENRTLKCPMPNGSLREWPLP